MKSSYAFFMLIFAAILSVNAYANKGLGLREKTYLNKHNSGPVTYTHSVALLIGIENYETTLVTQHEYSQRINPISFMDDAHIKNILLEEDWSTELWHDLPNVHSEMDSLHKVLEEQHGFTVIRVKDPTKKELKDQFEELISSYGLIDDARILVVINGHSSVIAGEGFLATSDSIHPRANRKSAVASSISYAQIRTWAREIQSKHTLFMLDSCFSGIMLGHKGLQNEGEQLSFIHNAPVKYFITAGDAYEPVPYDSTFIPSLSKILGGEYHNLKSKGFITSRELGVFFRSQMGLQGLASQSGALSGYQQGDMVFFFDRQVSEDPTINIDLGYPTEYKVVDRVFEFEEMNEHCEGARNIDLSVAATPGWEIKPFSIRPHVSKRKLSEFYGVVDSSESGFKVSGKVKNEGQCIKLGSNTIVKDARGKISGHVYYQEQRSELAVR